MTLKSIEARLSELERQVAMLLPASSNGPGKQDWRKTIGMFGDDEFMRGVMEEALKFREADRLRTKPKARKSKANK